jgi:sulfatase maturation enzyme AslB (radical SAM superfamily)
MIKFQRAKKHGESFLSSDQACSAILSWYKQRYELGSVKNYIIFYGGEPLLNKTVIEQGLNYISQLKNKIGKLKSLEILIVTNGYLLDENIINLCRKYSVTVVFGLDGLSYNQGRTRLNLTDAKSHSKVMNNIKQAQNASLNIALSMTLTPYNVPELFNTMGRLGEMGIRNVGFNFLKHANSFVGLETSEKLMEFWKYSSKIAFEAGKNFYGIVNEFQYSKKINAWNNRDFFPLDCTCLGNQIVVQADGQLTNCPFKHRDNQMVGDYNSLNIPSDWLNEFRGGHPLWNPAYVNIPEKALCGQGCTMGSEYPNNEPGIDWASYLYSREAFNDFVWIR